MPSKIANSISACKLQPYPPFNGDYQALAILYCPKVEKIIPIHPILQGIQFQQEPPGYIYANNAMVTNQLRMEHILLLLFLAIIRAVQNLYTARLITGDSTIYSRQHDLTG